MIIDKTQKDYALKMGKEEGKEGNIEKSKKSYEKNMIIDKRHRRLYLKCGKRNENKKKLKNRLNITKNMNK